jgi:hypothetical protein
MNRFVRWNRQFERVVMGFVVCVLSACGGGDPPPNSSTTVSLEYASVATISLAALGLSPSTNTSQISVVSGTAASLVVKDGEIRFLTPSDPGSDSTVVLKVAQAGSSTTISAVLRSARPLEAVTEIEPDDTGALPSAALNSHLIIGGLAPGNSISGETLSFSVSGAPPLDAKASAANVFIPQTGQTIDLAQDWTLDAATNTLSIPADKVKALLQSLPSGELEFDVALTSENGEFGVGWTFLAHKPTASLQGQLVGIDGTPQALGAGKSIAVKGIDNRTRQVIVADGSGAFRISPLDAGTYQLSILDVNEPGFWTATVPIFPTTTTASANIVYAPAASASSTIAITSVGSGQTWRGRTAVAVSGQNSFGPEPRASEDTLRPLSANPSSCETAGATGEASYVAVSGTRNNTISCVIAHTLPTGTTNVAIQFTVTTEEYPKYTTQKSRFNDTWAYAVSGLSGVSAASGSVNDSHYTQGTITKEYCVNVANAASSAPLVFNANLSATNIGDSILPTSVTLVVKLTCPNALKVTTASFKSPNINGNPVIKPISGNLPGNYISLPIANDVNNWGIPLDLQYEPKEAQITKVRIGVVVNGVTKMSDTDVSSMITTKSAGKLSFANLIIPRMPVIPFAGKTSVLIELTGTKDGQTLTSKPEDGPIKFGGLTSYVPLFVAGDQMDASRRYGGAVDAGLDSWATYNTIQWLLTKLYRFNDISGLHIAQTSTGRSILDHAGHSDGTQMDLRYSDGSGGYTEQLGGNADGSFIKSMLVAAAAEVAAAAATKPNLVKALAWIDANRTMLETESSAARKMHAGPSWMKLALYNGKFPNGVLIPGQDATGAPIAGPGTWTSKPTNLSFVEPHLHHWHISLTGI